MKVEGGNVFIGTQAKLSPQDTASFGNIYDARICEPESPCIKPPPGETAQCEGGACQTPPPLPAFQTPASSSFVGPGSLVGAPSQSAAKKPAVAKVVKCKKGYVKKKVKKKERCVKAKVKKKAKGSSRDGEGR